MKIAVIGRGNVGTRMGDIFGVEPISSRSLEGLPCDADLYIIAVSDSAVAEVAKRLPALGGVVAHTTGSVGLEALAEADCGGHGVFYPFQTLSSGKEIASSDIPLLLEASDSHALATLRRAAKEYGFNNIAECNSQQRRKVHLAGTFACNFTNALIGISHKILNEEGISASIAMPLIEETLGKLHTLTPAEAQTGPAIRKDLPTLEKHMELLTKMGMEREKDLYTRLSGYIMGDFNKN